jgi:glycosyltransferase involved in cell wall biosynthesis
MKNILVFIDWYWPGYKAGGTVRAFMNIVSYLKDDFAFYIITRNTDYTSSEPYTNVKSNEWNKLEDNVMVYYTSDGNISYKNWKKLVNERHYDAVYIHGIFSLWFSVLPVILSRSAGIKKILVAAHGMLGDHAFNVKPAKKNLFIRFARLSGLYKKVEFHAANAEEASDILKRAGKKAKVLIANELPKKEAARDFPPRVKTVGNLRLVWVARISPEKNLKFALEVLSGINQGEVFYDIYGPVYDEGYRDECLKVINSMPPYVHVEFKGSIAGDEVTEMLQGYHCMFLPTTGENFGHAILESLMAGCPVVISDRTPWKNLEKLGCGYDLPLGDTAMFREKLNILIQTGQAGFDTLNRNTLEYIRSYIKDPEALKENIALFKES